MVDFEEPVIRDRLVGLIAIATAAALAGVVIALAALELFVDAAGYRDWAIPRVVSNEWLQGVNVYPEHYVFMGVMLLIPAGYLLTLAIGIARARGWAWILGFVAGGLIALYGVLAFVIPGNVDANVDRWHVADGLPPLVLGGFLLWYFNRRATRRDLGWGDPAIG